MPEWLVVRQIRSPIRRHHIQRETLIGLGLNKIGRFAWRLDTPQTRGRISGVEHLVKVFLHRPLRLTPKMSTQLATLERFNRRVQRVEESGFWRRYKNDLPSVVIAFSGPTKVQSTGAATFTFEGVIHSWLEDFDQEELDAFVLSYRMFTQDNDSISIRSLARIYEEPWVPDEARENFERARRILNGSRCAESTIRFGEDAISVDALVDVVIYGGLAHTHKAKSELFETWEKSGVMGIIWAEVLGFLREFIEKLQFFRALNRQLLRYTKFCAIDPRRVDREELYRLTDDFFHRHPAYDYAIC